MVTIPATGCGGSDGGGERPGADGCDGSENRLGDGGGGGGAKSNGKEVVVVESEKRRAVDCSNSSERSPLPLRPRLPRHCSRPPRLRRTDAPLAAELYTSSEIWSALVLAVVNYKLCAFLRDQ